MTPNTDGMNRALESGKYSVRRQSLYEQSIELITKYILANNYALGSTLPTESEFASILNVGRNTVREALKTLQAMGIIDTRKTGMVLRGLNLRGLRSFLPYAAIDTNSNLKEMIAARYWYEDSIAPLVVQDATKEDIDKMKKNIDEMRNLDTHDPETSIDCDRRFHHLLANCVSNSIIREMGKTINEFFFLLPRMHGLNNKQSVLLIVDEHLSIVRSIEDRNAHALKEQINLYITKWLNTSKP